MARPRPYRRALADLAEGTDVNAVARRVGYRNVSAFARVFKQLTGHRPTEYFAPAAETTLRRELRGSPHT